MSLGLIRGALLAVALSAQAALCQEQYPMYIVAANWELTIVDLNQVTIVDRYIIDEFPPPLVERRDVAYTALLEPDEDFLYVTNYSGGISPDGSSPGLKIMRVDLQNRYGSEFFRDQPGEPSLMIDGGVLFYDSVTNELYASFDIREVTYVFDSKGKIIRQVDHPEGGDEPDRVDRHVDSLHQHQCNDHQ